MKRTIGIIGGMGPMATVDLYKKIVELTPVHSDNEHLHIVIDNNTNIPDRTASILEYGDNAIYELVRSAIKLEDMGADILIMPCNTAHFYYDEIKRFTKIPFINMVEETIKEVKNTGVNTVGILATDGTIKSGVYSRMCDKYGINYIIPEQNSQKEVMRIIYDGIKASYYDIDTRSFKTVVKKLGEAGAEKLILGCTELPIAFQRFNIAGDIIDPTLILARAAVKAAFEGEEIHYKEIANKSEEKL